jgi:hypothetical protein
VAEREGLAGSSILTLINKGLGEVPPSPCVPLV